MVLEEGGGRTDREFGIDMYTLLYLKWVTNKALLYSTGNSAQCYVAVWMGGESGREYICKYMVRKQQLELDMEQHTGSK